MDGTDKKQKNYSFMPVLPHSLPSTPWGNGSPTKSIYRAHHRHPSNFLRSTSSVHRMQSHRYGQDNLALAEMKVFLALFARRVEFDMTNTTADNIEWKKLSIIPKPKDGSLISVSSLSESTDTTGSRVVT